MTKKERDSIREWFYRLTADRLAERLTYKAHMVWEKEDKRVDALTAKLIVSRKKSIEKLDVEIAEFKKMEDATPLPVLKLTYQTQVKLRMVRRAKLAEELEALESVARAEAARSPELPGVAPKGPAKR